MTMLTKRSVARRLRALASRLDPLPVVPLAATIDSPMTEAGAKVLAEALSMELGQRVGLNYQRIDGSSGRVSPRRSGSR
jgi:hypothetical protein